VEEAVEEVKREESYRRWWYSSNPRILRPCFQAETQAAVAAEEAAALDLPPWTAPAFSPAAVVPALAAPAAAPDAEAAEAAAAGEKS